MNTIQLLGDENPKQAHKPKRGVPRRLVYWMTGGGGILLLFGAALALLAGQIPVASATALIGLVVATNSVYSQFFVKEEPESTKIEKPSTTFSKQGGLFIRTEEAPQGRPIQADELLDTINEFQKKVKDLKDIHNGLHGVEQIVKTHDLAGKDLLMKGIPRFKWLWENSTGEAFFGLRSIHDRVKSLYPSYLGDLLRKQESFLNALEEYATSDVRPEEVEEQIKESIRDILDTCRDRMFRIDTRLKTQVDGLSEYLSLITTRSIEDGSTGNAQRAA